MESLLEKYLHEGEETWNHIANRMASIYPNPEEALEIFKNKLFLPNTPAIVNAGTKRNLCACHAIEVENSIAGIMDAAKLSALIFKSGGGVGLELSNLWPAGTPLRFKGEASGPVGFLDIFNAVARRVAQGGLRRAAMMATMNAGYKSKKDLIDFIKCKEEDGQLSNFNVSVTVDAGPGSVDSDVWQEIVYHAWLNGEPGMVYLDNINRVNPTLRDFGRIVAVNACSEAPLYNFGSCVLGSVNLLNVVPDNLDLTNLTSVVRFAVRFLDHIITINNYPVEAIKKSTLKTRDIGVGVMGFADLLDRLGVAYNSKESLSLAEILAKTISDAAEKESQKIGKKLGGYLPGRRRNRVTTCIAPTGHISRLAGVWYSMYPRYDMALQMTPDEHLAMVEAWQKHIDNSISYTVNLPESAEVGDVDYIFREAHRRKLKAIAVYRDGSRDGQPLQKCGDGSCSM